MTYKTFITESRGVSSFNVKMAGLPPQCSSELKTLLACTAKLSVALSADPLEVAGCLLSRTLIPPGVESKMRIEALANRDKAGILVEAVRTKVETDPQTFSSFVEALSELSWTDEIVGVLRTTYRGKLSDPVPRLCRWFVIYAKLSK